MIITSPASSAVTEATAERVTVRVWNRVHVNGYEYGHGEAQEISVGKTDGTGQFFVTRNGDEIAFVVFVL